MRLLLPAAATSATTCAPAQEAACRVSTWRGLVAAKEQAARARPMPHLMLEGLRDGVILAATILGTILTVGLAALLLAEHTPVFDWLGAPIAPVLSWLGLQDAGRLAPAGDAGGHGRRPAAAAAAAAAAGCGRRRAGGRRAAAASAAAGGCGGAASGDRGGQGGDGGGDGAGGGGRARWAGQVPF